MKPFTTCVEALLIIVLMFSDSQLQGLLFVYDGVFTRLLFA